MGWNSRMRHVKCKHRLLNSSYVKAIIDKSDAVAQYFTPYFHYRSPEESFQTVFLIDSLHRILMLQLFRYWFMYICALYIKKVKTFLWKKLLSPSWGYIALVDSTCCHGKKEIAHILIFIKSSAYMIYLISQVAVILPLN